MRLTGYFALVFLALVGPSTATVRAQDMPAEYQAVLTSLNKKGDFKDGVLKVNIPRADLHVTIGGRPAPTPFGFGGWLALAKGDAGMHVMMGDLVLTEDEVNPVMSALLQNGIDVTALHNHFFHEQPRDLLHARARHGGSRPISLARVKPAVDLIDRAAVRGRTGGRRTRPTHDAGRRLPRRDRRAPGRAVRTGLQNHHRPARHRPPRARRRHHGADGAQHVGRLRGNGRRRDGRRRRGDARYRGDAGAQGPSRDTASRWWRSTTT